MDAIQINLNSPIYGLKELVYKQITECNGELLITLNGKECYDIYPGDNLIFKRYIYENNNEHFVLTDYVTVISEDEKHVLHTTLLPTNKIPLYNGIENVKTISGTTYAEDGTEEEYVYHLIKCRTPHNIFPQDASLQEIDIKDCEGNLLGHFKDIFIPLKREDRPTVVEDCVTFIESADTCGSKYKFINYYKYDFLPEKVSRDTILVSGFDISIVEKMAYIETKHNPYMYYILQTNDNGEVEKNAYGEDIKMYNPFVDNWWFLQIPSLYSGNKICLNSGNTRSILAFNNAYWNVNLGLGNIVNESTMGAEDSFGTSYIKDIEDSLIPDVIDMERVKYTPMVCSGVTTLKDGSKYAEFIDIATSITFNMHFRERNKIDTSDDKIEMKQRAQNSSFTSGNVYTDGWYINPDSADEIWWNGVPSGKTAFTQINFSEFIGNSGETSDLLGVLNFTDNDVYYRKKKVSQSFIRLTFYTSPDPIEQKILFHSTIFLDASTLYGKYIKQRMYMEENDLFNRKKNKDINLNAAVVFCSADTVSARVDTKIVVTNEYDRTKSSEGFNIYLFAEDINFQVNENGEKTIYMKVEFNHAGIGKTIPMILWPKFYWDANLKNDDNTKGGYRYTNEYQPLTMSNFMRALYIPIQITYFNDRYVYYIPDAKNYMEDGNISLVLFEPKLDFDPLEGQS